MRFENGWLSHTEDDLSEAVMVEYREGMREKGITKIPGTAKKRVTCPICKRITMLKDTIPHDGEKYCSDCYEKRFRTSIEEDLEKLRHEFKYGIHLQSSLQWF